MEVYRERLTCTYTVSHIDKHIPAGSGSDNHRPNIITREYYIVNIYTSRVRYEQPRVQNGRCFLYFCWTKVYSGVTKYDKIINPVPPPLYVFALWKLFAWL